MSYVGASIMLSGLGVATTGYLTAIFPRDPQDGLKQTTHHTDNLLPVMTNRYIAMTAFAAAATYYGDLKVIAFLFASYAFMGFADAVIYARAGKPILKHVTAGMAAMIIVIAAIRAQNTNGAV